MLPNLIQQFSMAIEKAIAQDMERTTGVYFCSLTWSDSNHQPRRVQAGPASVARNHIGHGDVRQFRPETIGEHMRLDFPTARIQGMGEPGIGLYQSLVGSWSCWVRQDNPLRQDHRIPSIRSLPGCILLFFFGFRQPRRPFCHHTSLDLPDDIRE